MSNESVSPPSVTLPRRCAAKVAAAVFLALLTPVLIAGCTSSPSPVGNPDPGHLLLSALRPVATVVPNGVTITQRTFTEPTWDSCDGVKSSFGWDPVNVDVQFIPHGMTDAAVYDHIKAALSGQGWTLASASSDGAWDWTRTINGTQSVIQLLAGGGAGTSNLPGWDLQANAPPATHPVKGC